MNEITMSAVSDILDSFDVDEVVRMLDDQITNEEEDYTSQQIDHFQPLYRNYRKLMEKKDEEDEDTIHIGKDRFYQICYSLLALIEKKYDIAIDEDWLENNQRSLPAVALAYYSVFVLEFYQNLLELFWNYISSNKSDLAETFDDYTSRKDATTLANRKGLDDESALIASNIYDITQYILENLDEPHFFKYLDEGYVPGGVIQSMYRDGVVTGDFMHNLATIYASNTALKAQIGFEIIFKIRNGGLSGSILPPRETSSESEEDTEEE